MQIDAVGIASDGAGPTTYLDTLEQNLDYLQSVGYELIEIDSTPFRLVVDLVGCVNPNCVISWRF